jgi:hypothetical protein
MCLFPEPPFPELIKNVFFDFQKVVYGCTRICCQTTSPTPAGAWQAEQCMGDGTMDRTPLPNENCPSIFGAFDTYSVTRLGEISPFGRYFLALGAFFFKKYRPNDLCAVSFQNNRPKFASNFDGQKFLFAKAPFWAILELNWAIFFTERLVTLDT